MSGSKSSSSRLNTASKRTGNRRLMTPYPLSPMRGISLALKTIVQYGTNSNPAELFTSVYMRDPVATFLNTAMAEPFRNSLEMSSPRFASFPAILDAWKRSPISAISSDDMLE